MSSSIAGSDSCTNQLAMRNKHAGVTQGMQAKRKQNIPGQRGRETITVRKEKNEGEGEPDRENDDDVHQATNAIALFSCGLGQHFTLSSRFPNHFQSRSGARLALVPGHPPPPSSLRSSELLRRRAARRNPPMLALLSPRTAATTLVPVHELGSPGILCCCGFRVSLSTVRMSF